MWNKLLTWKLHGKMEFTKGIFYVFAIPTYPHNVFENEKHFFYDKIDCDYLPYILDYTMVSYFDH